MAMNRVQFQPGLSMIEFLDRYGSEDKCEAALVESRWRLGCLTGVIWRPMRQDSSSSALPVVPVTPRYLRRNKRVSNSQAHSEVG